MFLLKLKLYTCHLVEMFRVYLPHTAGSGLAEGTGGGRGFSGNGLAVGGAT